MTATKITNGLEDMFIEFMLNDDELFQRCIPILNREHWAENNKKIIEYMLDQNKKYGKVPDRHEIKNQLALKNVGCPEYQTGPDRYEWFIDTFADWVKFKNFEDAVMAGAKDISDGNYDVILQRFIEASKVGLSHDLGLDWHSDATAVISKVKERRGEVSTGFTELDRLTYGGFSRGELNFFLGKSGAGKSIFLANTAHTWHQAGLNVLYVTLEMSREDVAIRNYMIHLGMSSKEVFANPDKVNTAVQISAKSGTAGHLVIHEMTGLQTSTASIRSFLKENEAQNGYKFDAVVVDYMDIMVPNDRTIRSDNKHTIDEHISTELRELAKSEDILVLTASQANREGTDTDKLEYKHVAGGLSKIKSADNIIGIITSETLREQGKYKLQILKTRNSPGTGKVINLKFNTSTLKVSDFTEEELAQIALEEGKLPSQTSLGRAAKKAVDPAEQQKRRDKMFETMKEFGGK